MPGPIGYTPPANAYSAMPIEPQSFHGLSPLPGMAAAQQAMAPAQAQIDKSEAFDTQAAQAVKFQKLLQSGQQGMQSYIQDVAKTNPELAAQFTQEFQTVAPFMQNLKGKDLTDFAFNTYDSWNGRVGGAKLGSYMKQNPNASTADLLGQTNGGMTQKDMIGAVSTDFKNQSTAKLNQSKIDWYTQLPQLKRELGEAQNRSRERAAQFRAQYQSAKGKLDPAVAKTNLAAVLEEIKDTRVKIQGMEESMAENPTMANVNAVPGTLGRYQSYLKELMDDRDDYQKALGAGAANPGTTPPPALGTKTASGLDVNSTDEQIAKYIRTTPKKDNTFAIVTPELIKQIRERLAKKGAPPAP